MKIKPINCFLLLFLLGAMEIVGIAQTSQPKADKPEAAPPLTATQVQAIKSIRIESAKKAAPIAMRLATAANQIYENMLSEKEDDALRQRLSKQMNDAAVGLLSIKGQSIRDMVRVLTPAQRQLIRNEMKKLDAPSDLSELIMRVFGVPEK